MSLPACQPKQWLHGSRTSIPAERTEKHTDSGMSLSSWPERAASSGRAATYAAIRGLSCASSSWKGCRSVTSPQPMQITLYMTEEVAALIFCPVCSHLHRPCSAHKVRRRPA